MKRKSSSLIPILICAGVIASVCALEWLGEREIFTPQQRVEWITYDWRVRLAAGRASAMATNLGVVEMSDDSLGTLLDGSLGYKFGLQWPRQVYARLLNELHQEGAKAVGFDIVFAESRPDHPSLVLDGRMMTSDGFFAGELRRAGTAILAAERGMTPAEMFSTNAWAVADISATREVDSLLRRAHAFTDVRVWHPLIRQAARPQHLGWKLAEAKLEEGMITFPTFGGTNDSMAINANHEFDAARIGKRIAEESPDGVAPRMERAFTDQRLWQMGILLAAREMEFDLGRAVVDLEHGEIVLQNARGERRVIPVDRRGRFYIDWALQPSDARLTVEPVERLLARYRLRKAGHAVPDIWAGKLVVVGSTATGNNLTDLGATPLSKETFLMSEHWNVANSVLTNRFIQSLSLTAKFLLIALFGIGAAIITLTMRPIPALLVVGLVAAGFVAFACWAFIRWRLWIPIVLPVGGSLLVTHGMLLIHLVRLEQRRRKHTRDIFSSVVSPDIVRELLGQEKLRLGGARRRITMYFADVRGFTEVTDMSQQRAEAFVAQRNLTGEEAERHFDAEAELVLNTVNPYLGLVADVIKKHGGSLDKYIGDCVMAFWGAPTANPRHAVACVCAAIEAQRAVLKLNHQRQSENDRRVEENFRRAAAGQEPLPMLDLLTLGSGINTGVVTVGMVGSEAHQKNYTIFGREVNLASRLEGASGRARILIGEQTFRELLRDDPELASTCIEHPPLSLKGFRDAVKAYEVMWRPKDVSVDEAGQSVTIIRSKVQREMPY